jgi:uncharacterized membrane protein YdjX (TVP38/TMEM64 family)
MNTSKKWSYRIVLAIVVGLVVVGVIFYFRDAINLSRLASHESTLRQWRDQRPFTSGLIALGLYIVVASLSIPGAVVMTAALGWFFGFWYGCLIASFGSTGGATLAFLSSRYLLHDFVQDRWAERLEKVNAAFRNEGAYYLLTLRLIPMVPFFLINLAMGLTPVRVWTFWWVSQLGMLPGTAAYVYAGSTVPSLRQLADDGIESLVSWKIFLALFILGIQPLLIRWIINRFKSKPATDSG